MKPWQTIVLTAIGIVGIAGLILLCAIGIAYCSIVR